MFLEIGESAYLMFISANRVEEFLENDAQVFAVFSSLRIGSKAAIMELLVVWNFIEVFHDDISVFPLEREMEFVIDLVPGTSPVSMAPWRMYTSELSELKK